MLMLAHKISHDRTFKTTYATIIDKIMIIYGLLQERNNIYIFKSWLRKVNIILEREQLLQLDTNRKFFTL